MALLIPPGFCHAVYELALSFDDEPMVTTCGHALEGTAQPIPPDAVADNLHALFGTNIMPKVSDAYQLTGVTVYIGNDGPPIIGVSTLAAVPGGSNSEPIPQNTAWLIKKRTGAAGRRGRGRMYVPGVAEGYVEPGGKLTSTGLAFYQDAASDWLLGLETDVAGVSFPPVVLHRSEGIGVEPAPTPVTSLQVDEVVATQRRRLRK